MHYDFASQSVIRISVLCEFYVKINLVLESQLC